MFWRPSSDNCFCIRLIAICIESKAAFRRRNQVWYLFVFSDTCKARELSNLSFILWRPSCFCFSHDWNKLPNGNKINIVKFCTRVTLYVVYNIIFIVCKSAGTFSTNSGSVQKTTETPLSSFKANVYRYHSESYWGISPRGAYVFGTAGRTFFLISEETLSGED